MVLVVQASVLAYLTRFAVKIFFLGFAQREKKKKFIRKSYVQGHLSRVLNQEFLFFGSRVVGFASNPSCLKYWLLCPFFYVEAICKGSTGKGLPYAAKATSKGLLYAPDPDNRKKGTLSDQPRLLRISSTALLCCWGSSHSKI